MRIAVGTDEASPLFDGLRAHLEGMGHEVAVVTDRAPWPDAGREVGEVVASGRADGGEAETLARLAP